MKNYYGIKRKTTSSMYDNNFRLRFDEILTIMQDLATAHSYDMQVDHEKLLKSSNAFWVLSRAKFKINKHVKNNTVVYYKTWPLKPSGVRFTREFSFIQNKSVILSGRSEWCILDSNSYTLRRLDSVVYPNDLNYIKKFSDTPDFCKEKFSVSDEDYVYDYKIAFTDIDVNNHTNNVAYCRMALNCFSVEEFNNKDFSTFEIKFINQTFYGDEIKLYKKIIDKNAYYIEGITQNKKVFYSIISK